MAVVIKSYENVLIRVFLHAEFISALKTEPKSMVFEKYAKNGKKIFIIIIFYFLRFLYKSFNQRFLIPTEIMFLRWKEPNIAKLVDIIFLRDCVKNRYAIALAKFNDKWLLFSNPMKLCLLGYFCMLNSFLHRELCQNLWFLRNMQKWKNIIYYRIIIFYFLRFLYKSFN